MRSCEVLLGGGRASCLYPIDVPPEYLPQGLEGRQVIEEIEDAPVERAGSIDDVADGDQAVGAPRALMPQVGLQSMVNIQAVILAALPLLLVGVSTTVTGIIAAIVLSEMAILQEGKLVHAGKSGNKPRETRS